MEGMDVDLDAELMQKFSCLGTTDKDVLIGEFQRLLGFQLSPAGCAFFLDMTNWYYAAGVEDCFRVRFTSSSGFCDKYCHDNLPKVTQLQGHMRADETTHEQPNVLGSDVTTNYDLNNSQSVTQQQTFTFDCKTVSGHAGGRNLQAAIGAYYDFESPNINVPSMSFVEDVTIGEGESIPPDTQFTKTWRIQNTGTEAWPPGVCLKYVGGDQFGHVNMVMVRSLEPQEIADVSVQMCSPSTAGMYQGQWRMCTATGLYYGDIIWVILSVEVGGLLGVTQQLSSFETEFNTQPHRKVEGNFNPFASPQKNRQPDENNLKDPGGSELDTISKNTWGPAPDQIEQDQTELSQNSVNLSPSSHSNNLSVMTYSKVCALGMQENGEVMSQWPIL
ncbi:Protein ILRUN [Varanus komodoensis]|nr:Protein ILRUN [Varanus komodoensis]